jgi:hypothetical protein
MTITDKDAFSIGSYRESFIGMALMTSLFHRQER